MTITHVPELNSTLWRLGLYGNAGQPGSTAPSSPGAASLLSGTPAQAGGFAGAIVQALSQMGVPGAQSALSGSPASASSSSSGSAGASGSAGSSGTPGSSSASRALHSFMQTLLAALQAQAVASSNQHGVSAASALAPGASGHRHSHAHPGGGGLQSLIQELSASSSAATTVTSSAAGSAPSGTNTASVANARLMALQQSFNNLVSSVGGSSGQASLGTFLTTLANDLSSGAPTANLVNTHA